MWHHIFSAMYTERAGKKSTVYFKSKQRKSLAARKVREIKQHKGENTTYSNFISDCIKLSFHTFSTCLKDRVRLATDVSHSVLIITE